MNTQFNDILNASSQDQRDVFLKTAQRLGVTEQYVEKDFWVCWTLDALFNGLRPGSARLLFKGGTSLSKAFSLIQRFSEDIDITVFREDLGVEATVEQLKSMTGKKRQAKLDTILDACKAYIAGPMRDQLHTALQNTRLPAETLRIELDPNDPDQQTLLVHYPSVTGATPNSYVRSVVRIESGAKSALDPHVLTTITPYIQHALDTVSLHVDNITTIEPQRTFWDKVVILHGQRRWYENRKGLQHEGQRVSRHYYDLHCMLGTPLGHKAVLDRGLGRSCSLHAQMFFNRRDYDLATAGPGTFALVPPLGMTDVLRRDYFAMAPMIIGSPPDFDEILASIQRLQDLINADP
jgi:hypothetical protein